MLVEKGRIKLYHIHIPRTGGRYISNLFDQNGFTVHFQQTINFYRNSIVEELLTYPYYETLYNFEDIPTFTVIRHPVDRFISVATYDFISRKIKNYGEIFRTKDSLLHYIKEQQTLHSYHNNFFTSQHKFIGPKTKLWKFEKGFDNKFVDWLNQEFNINLLWKIILYKHINKVGIKFLDDYEKIKIPDESRIVLEEFYAKDLEIWNNL
tara:strand:- start:582 stop:1205 length:624 start_codon:yes stop_codon:yes gene_type:complete